MAIYQAGLFGKKQTQPFAVEALEAAARERMSPEAYDYVAGGAGGENSIRGNLAAFQRWQIVPRFLRNVERRDLSVELLNQRFRAPLLLAPIGVQSIIHPEGELAVARVAKALDIPMILSTLSSFPMEKIAEILGNSPRWFQLYWPKNPDLAASLVTRAEKSGFSAIVVTLDTYLLGWRERDLQRSYLPFLEGKGIANYLSDPVFRASLSVPPETDPRPAIMAFMQVVSNPALGWDDLEFLRRHTRLPILLKGILSPDDARQALDQGVAGLIVSNHGGRQLDGAIAALDALPRVVDAIQQKVPVLFDSGIRRGSDILKAVALGAKAVLLGRPYCYGLAVGGEIGVRTVIENLLADFDLSLGLAGCANLGELSRANLLESVAGTLRVP
jgi:isopentenyl diphosphate isomerase/L-lactate dehydrogenase-like FMN-dependent dehydrogenase